MHPLLLTTGGTGVGALVILAVAATGFLPMTAHTGTATLAGAKVAWWLPLLLLVTVSAVFAYLTGTSAYAGWAARWRRSCRCRRSSSR